MGGSFLGSYGGGGMRERVPKDQLGMAKHVFRQMVQQLSMRTSANHTRHVGLEEQVAIFLYTIATNLSNQKVAEHFQRSGYTISKYIAPVLSLSR
jgi:hypothetical protein